MFKRDKLEEMIEDLEEQALELEEQASLLREQAEQLRWREPDDHDAKYDGIKCGDLDD